MHKKNIIFFICILIASACTVKEPRDGGPCTLYEDCGNMSPLTLSLWRDNSCIDEVSSDGHEVLVFTLERGRIIVTASYAASHTRYNGGILSLGTDMPVDSTYAYSQTLDCNAEWVQDIVVRHKQFATITLSVNIKPESERYPDSLRIISAWNGLDVRTMAPTKGTWYHTIPNTGTKMSFRLMRQGDDSLVLRMIKKTTGTIDDIPLGEILQNAGYSWEDEDLKDIEIIVEEASATLRIIIPGWNDGEPIIEDI